jgi:exopolysaccharide production protein ExoQ
MKRAERLFHILAFTWQCNAFLPLLSRGSGDTGELGAATTLGTIITTGVLVVVLVLILSHWRMALRLVPGIWPVLALVSLALLSAAWSDYRSVTVHRAGSFATVTMWAWYIAARYDLKDVISIVRQAMWPIALASLAIGFGAPGLGQMPDGDGWLGVFQTKNNLGTVMAIGIVLFFYTLLAEMFSQRPRFLSTISSVAGLLLCGGLLYLSHSSTSWVTGLIGLIFCVVAKLTQKRVGVAIITGTATVLLLAPAVLLAMDQLETIASMLGKDSTLSGRVDLWLMLPSYIMQRPWLGHGFGAFWVEESANVFEIWMAVDWQPPTAHNGWLDLLLELGVVGLSFTTIQIFLLLTNGIRAVIDGQEPGAQYLLATIFALLIHNLTESDLVRPGASWDLLVIATVALAKIARQRQTTSQTRFAGRFQRREPTASPRGG